MRIVRCEPNQQPAAIAPPNPAAYSEGDSVNDKLPPEVAARIITDSLGFRLEVHLTVAQMDGRGLHKTYECDGVVSEDAVHRIEISKDLSGDELAEVCAHEAYHLFYAIRNLITVDEELQATVFGQLVKRMVAYQEGFQDD